MYDFSDVPTQKLFTGILSQAGGTLTKFTFCFACR